MTHVSGSYTFKKLILKKGCKGGLQYHRFKNEAGFLVSGKLIIRYADSGNTLKERVVLPGESFHFPPFSVHQEEAIEECVILEASNPVFNDRVDARLTIPYLTSAKVYQHLTNLMRFQMNKKRILFCIDSTAYLRHLAPVILRFADSNLYHVDLILFGAKEKLMKIPLICFMPTSLIYLDFMPTIERSIVIFRIFLLIFAS